MQKRLRRASPQDSAGALIETSGNPPLNVCVPVFRDAPGVQNLSVRGISSPNKTASRPTSTGAGNVYYIVRALSVRCWTMFPLSQLRAGRGRSSSSTSCNDAPEIPPPFGHTPTHCAPRDRRGGAIQSPRRACSATPHEGKLRCVAVFEAFHNGCRSAHPMWPDFGRSRARSRRRRSRIGRFRATFGRSWCEYTSVQRCDRFRAKFGRCQAEPGRIWPESRQLWPNRADCVVPNLAESRLVRSRAARLGQIRSEFGTQQGPKHGPKTKSGR